jgi:hypothetical protein
MQGVIQEARQVFREMPVYAAAVIVMVALGMGAHAAIFYEADGEDLRLIADRSEPNDAVESDDPMTRMRARLGCTEKIPGFTVIVGLSHYNVELSVPVRGMQTMLDRARPDVAGMRPRLSLRRAA